MTGDVNTVKRRRVFYIPGYDPIPPRRYRELYRRESAEQARVSGYEISVQAGERSARYGWDVSACMNEQQIESRIEVLVWFDIVRESMGGSILSTYCQLFRTAWVYLSTGALFRLMRLRKGPVIAALYPVGMLLLQLLLACLIGLAVYKILPFGVGAIIGCLTIWAVLQAFRRLDGRFLAYYLMHDYAFSAATNGAYTPQLENRLAEFSSAIEEAMDDCIDEVLVVGHSSGAYLAVSVLADLMRSGNFSERAPALSFLSLGQVVPMVSFLPDAKRLRWDLAYLSQSEALTWVDVSAPGDGCSFALCDPVAVSGVAPAQKRWPLVFSAAFTKSLSPERWKALKWRFFRVHFQYLCAFDRPRDYDYFALTAGPMTLGARYADRPASRSRKEMPVNRFTSVS